MKILIFFIYILILPNYSFADVINVDNLKIIKLIDKGTPIIDIRRADEWSQTGVIPGSHLLTFFDKQGNYNKEKWLSNLGSIVKNNMSVIIICRSGRRSGIVSKLLDEGANYSNVYNASGGILSWIKSNNKTVKPN